MLLPSSKYFGLVRHGRGPALSSILNEHLLTLDGNLAEWRGNDRVPIPLGCQCIAISVSVYTCLESEMDEEAYDTQAGKIPRKCNKKTLEYSHTLRKSARKFLFQFLKIVFFLCFF